VVGSVVVVVVSRDVEDVDAVVDVLSAAVVDDAAVSLSSSLQPASARTSATQRALITARRGG
ncbi:MAG: hypothetical protein KDB15_16810, partial [Microthrixaceae bacterium]|nr:hypothetical protein [Microthrixaceae bacterium]